MLAQDVLGYRIMKHIYPKHFQNYSYHKHFQNKILYIYILKYNVLFNQNDQNIYCHYSLKSLFFFPQCHYHNFIPRFSSHFKQNKHSIISCKMYLVVILKQFRNLVDMIWMDELIHELCFLCVLRTTDPIRFAHIYRTSKGRYCYKHWILIIMS